jgi:Predicted ATPase
VKLIRSKGVGVFFCTQLPTDVPNAVLSQLGARIQHALRAFTPEDQAALAKTVKTYPTTKNYDMEEALTSLGTGEAIVTVLSERGAPTPVAWARMRAPRSLMAAIGAEEVTAVAKASPLFAKYGQTVDRESAYEKLTARIAAPPPEAAPADAPPPAPGPERRPEKEEPGMVADVLGSPVVKSFLRSAASALGREITRGLFGTRRR